ncbi:hypothetical protein NX059_001865 [Plenodomus lindquistii]|nr:hypothetical protein NX059_001865 [Plenodomus lindquistii]
MRPFHHVGGCSARSKAETGKPASPCQKHGEDKGAEQTLNSKMSNQGYYDDIQAQSDQAAHPETTAESTNAVDELADAPGDTLHNKMSNEELYEDSKAQPDQAAQPKATVNAVAAGDPLVAPISTAETGQLATAEVD